MATSVIFAHLRETGAEGRGVTEKMGAGGEDFRLDFFYRAFQLRQSLSLPRDAGTLAHFRLHPVQYPFIAAILLLSTLLAHPSRPQRRIGYLAPYLFVFVSILAYRRILIINIVLVRTVGIYGSLWHYGASITLATYNPKSCLRLCSRNQRIVIISHRSVYILFILALWLAMGILAIFTAIASLASSGRSDCTSFTAASNTSYSTITIAGGGHCTRMDDLADIVHIHSSYFQSAHIIIIRLIGTLALLVYKPSLTAMMWSALQTFTAGVPLLHVDAFQQAVGLSSSPALLPAALYVKASRTLPFKVVFVLLVSILSLLSPLAVSPIYRPHAGPYLVDATLEAGGGVYHYIHPFYFNGVWVPEGVSTGRALLAAGVLMGIPVFPKTFNVSVAPFLSMATINEIWSAEVDIVVARNTVDCSASAPARLNSTEPVVALDMPHYFAPDRYLTASSPTFLGQDLGEINNDPEVTAVYINSSVSVQPGSVTAETSVIFLAANGTLEGAQQTITSPNPTARIASVDVLVCTSTTALETSHCVINQGNVTSCTAFVMSNASASSTGGLDAYIQSPADVAIILSASPVMAYYSLPSHLPMSFISNSVVAAVVPPMPDLAYNTSNAEKYHVSLDYITNILFPQTAQALVQGMNQALPVPMANQPVFLIATFATSNPQLSYLILAICAACALTATVAGGISFKKYPAPLDVVRLLAISRTDQLDDVFAPYSDISVPVDDNVLQRRIGYSEVDKLDSRVLVVDKLYHD
ncbi:hypothetical protein FIBSPDRAFT_933472 [Athelia psychrophila]|uniref:Transmembrane protein n=1 Tax=Athelia psychrophila TaxID=1759441 RepID=A0A166H018_9AGAM|nr:hypothetical protein FIBSPDRAFT_933472 [Fibularhizoctonia sp. CBS 109695]